MPLIKACQQCLGSRLFVLPQYGYGWGRQDVNAPQLTPLESLGPEPFYLRADELIYCDEQIMGISGIIEGKEHEFSDYWCCCLLRNPDECNLTNQVGDYLIWIAKGKLQIDPAPFPKKALVQWIKFDKSEFCLCGFGKVAESIQLVQNTYEMVMASRKLAAEEK